jgi:putative tricarboxylic transport membrane protein
VDVLHNIGLGFEEALTLNNLLFCFLGVSLGTIIGILPGLGSSAGMTLLLPLTIGLPPTTALILLAGLYYGASHGGVVTSVLAATPGESSSVVLVLDGYQLARRGRAGPVLAMSALSSFLSGTLTIPVIMTLTPALAHLSLAFGPPEISVVMLIGLVGIVGFMGKNRLKGFAMAGLGLIVATVGLDAQTGTPRFTFGIPQMYAGIDFLYVVVGTFALAQIMQTVGTGQPVPIRARLRDMLLTADDWRRSRMSILRGGIIGFLVGLVPGAGATVAAFLSYDVERRVGKRHGRILGTGLIEGVTGPQAADNAAANGAFVPTLALGIPGSGPTAVLLGAFLLHGVEPGPLLMTTQPALVWGLLASFYVGNVMLLIVNFPLAPLFASILRLRFALLYPPIIAVCLIGSFSVDNDMTGVWLTFAFGFLGWLGLKLDYPFAPLVLGTLLGGPFETAVAQSAAIGRGSMSIYLHRPVALCLIAVVLLMLIGPTIIRRLGRARSPAIA